MSSEKITTLHPEGKKGVNIDKDKYDQIKKAILDHLEKVEKTTYKELDNSVRKNLEGQFQGKISWYVVTVKLDLEARGFLKRKSKTSPQVIYLTKKG